MSKNSKTKTQQKKPTKIISPKKIAAQAKKLYHKAENDSPFGTWGNKLFDSSLTDNIKNDVENFIKETTASFCGSTSTSNQTNNIAKDIITKFANNIRHNFEQNMELGREILKCKTAVDCIEFQRKNFELNYKNAVKTYNEFFHDMQNLATQNSKNMTK